MDKVKIKKTLTEKEYDILERRNGLYDGIPKKLWEIGKVYDISGERVRQLEKKAYIKVRERHNELRDIIT